MKRSVGALAAGYLAILLLEGFVRFILSVYSGANITLAGVSGFPSPLLGYLLTGAGLIFGLIGGFITCSLADTSPDFEILSLIILVMAAGFFSFYISNADEPLWYIITGPLLKALGVYFSFILYQRQTPTENIAQP